MDDLDTAFAVPGDGCRAPGGPVSAGGLEQFWGVDGVDDAGRGATVGTFGCPVRGYVLPRQVSEDAAQVGLVGVHGDT